MGALPIYAKMQTAQLKAAAPACAVARPSMAQRSAFKAAPAPSVARPSFARRVQKLQKAASVQARNVVVVRAADDKVRPGAAPRRLWGSRGFGRRAGMQRRPPRGRTGSKAPPPPRAAGAAPRPAAVLTAQPLLPAAGGGDRPGRRLRLRQVHLHAPVRG